MEISQSIKLGDLTSQEALLSAADDSLSRATDTPGETLGSLPIADVVDFNEETEKPFTKAQEDAILRESTRDLPDWVANFVRRIILLLENLPEEPADGSRAGGDTEGNIDRNRCLAYADHLFLTVQVVDSVAAAASQIFVHLSEPLYDMVLNMIYDYATTTVRSNAVRAIHQLVECVANADPYQTLAKFLPVCKRNIEVELENGASSVRTTANTVPVPSDATLHWSEYNCAHMCSR